MQQRKIWIKQWYKIFFQIFIKNELLSYIHWGYYNSTVSFSDARVYKYRYPFQTEAVGFCESQKFRGAYDRCAHGCGC